MVKGRKEIEAGLIHRLDTPTAGLLLIAKTQSAYDFFIDLQSQDRIEKTYLAISELDETKASYEKINKFKCPKKISSQFRPFGPKARMVAPVFSDDHRYKDGAKIYTTYINSIEKLSYSNLWSVECSLSKGYRHQIRSHLASCALPIQGDALYNPKFLPKTTDEVQNHSYPLQLYALSISINS